ncbi:hypothetical protein TVAG_092760 [Trichomonas vaginalis G3]|uniref:Glycosyltransferase RgtA/B/C/D-like domain-containing protein n=1 Tax=Trichomonas vaginalis (strain ATCC PRA-98 / G3) TaxID=412133 RepID=A2FTT3_TRIV3|nr:hypothetical protein TVAGG3_0060670 [Trichomonas vaginalis G3]EAX91690.1 hypothetical protein TVAG_092760 [Trichomonas vaginalis G3]KAI5541982.1 hypothetical protein TVAGG3_0060670 [Trichomonas vaginalis G3]|eukprot:XP_001304620.1 hypothetical protein [Trichomonas vaginalis G3]
MLNALIWDGLLNEGYYTHGASFGDFPFHMNIISSFVYGCNKNRKHLFDLVSPFYAHKELAYPFIPNYYSSVLISCYGVSIHDATVFPSIPVSIALYIILVDLIFEFTKSEFAAIIGVYLFTYNGGMGFTHFFYEKYRQSWFIDYVHYWDDDWKEFWLQAVSHVLLPQRASLFSMPIAWSVILILMRCNERGSATEFIAAGLLVALLPQIHPHSIIALAQWGVVFALITFPYKKVEKMPRFIMRYMCLGITAIVFGAFQCIPLIGRSTQNDFMKIQPINRGEFEKDIITLWCRGLGPFIVMALIHSPLILNKTQWKFYIPSIVVFLLGNIIYYQPWALDNTKVFYAAFIPLATASVSLFMKKLTKFGFLGVVTFIVLFMFSIFSGILSVYVTWKTRSIEWDIYAASYNSANFIINNTPPDSIWISDNQHQNPIVTLAGRQIFVGYIGWLMNHGLDFESRQEIMNRLVDNPEDTTEIDEFNITYVGVRYSDPEYPFYPPDNSTKWSHIYSSVAFDIWQRTSEK